MQRLNIIGCGKVGKTLARLWLQHGVFQIGDILNKSAKSSSKAVEFIGAGQVVSSIQRLNHADIFLIATPDSHIVENCEALSNSGVLQPGNIVFHCSGAIPSVDLSSVKKYGAMIASVHPVNSFADPEISSKSFGGTFCGIEGDEASLKILRPAFEAIGGLTFAVDPEYKTVYHAANVIVCNYLTSLLEFGIQAYSKAGLERETAMQVMQPIVQGTVDNIFKMGTTKALTGPIARGDDVVVARQLHAMADWNPHFAELYRELGSVALELSRQQGTASASSLSALTKLLDKP